MNETQNTQRECPHSINITTSTKGVVTVDVKQYYASETDGLTTLTRLKTLMQEAARLFPTFCLGEDLMPRQPAGEGVKR